MGSDQVLFPFVSRAGQSSSNTWKQMKLLLRSAMICKYLTSATNKYGEEHFIVIGNTLPMIDLDGNAYQVIWRWLIIYQRCVIPKNWRVSDLQGACNKEVASVVAVGYNRPRSKINILTRSALTTYQAIRYRLRIAVDTFFYETTTIRVPCVGTRALEGSGESSI